MAEGLEGGGDHVDLRLIAGRREASVLLAEKLNAADGKGEAIWLPKLGIKVKSYLLVQENINDRFAHMIIDRLRG